MKGVYTLPLASTSYIVFGRELCVGAEVRRGDGKLYMQSHFAHAKHALGSDWCGQDYYSPCGFGERWLLGCLRAACCRLQGQRIGLSLELGH